MECTGNYLIQANHAKAGFLGYDQETLIQKLKLPFDDDYLYTTFLTQPYRIHRRTGDISRQVGEKWVDGNSYEEVMTLLDLICDSREDRYLACRWKNMRDFGHQFHQDMLENPNDPYVKRFDADPEGFRRACLALHGTPLPQGDAAYAIDFFDGLPIALQLWLGDEEFPPQLKIMWDENADMYLKYETMHFAKSLVLRRIEENM